MIDLSFLNILVQEFTGWAQETFVSLLSIPPSISLTSAITLTFAWLYSEFASIFKIMRGLAGAAWALTVGNSFIGAKFFATIEFWLLVGVVVALNLTWVLLRKRKGALICPNCGNKSRFNVILNVKKPKTAEFESISCADCGSSDIKRKGKTLRQIYIPLSSKVSQQA